MRAGGSPSAGTYHSAITAFSRVRDYAKVSAERRRAEPRPTGRRVHGVRGIPRHESVVDAWVLPFPTIDPQIVLRSARALDRYGPDFAYGHYVAIKRLPVAVGGVVGVASLFALAQLPPGPRLPPRPHALRPGAERGAAAQGLVLGPVRRPRRRRPARRDGGQRRGPRLRRDGQDAGRGDALPGARRPAAHRGPGHDRGGHGPGRCASRLQRAGIGFSVLERS